MPLKDYKCVACNKVVTILTPRETPPEHCGDCGAEMFRYFGDNVTHSQVDGNFDTTPVGVKISEKNNALRRKYED